MQIRKPINIAVIATAIVISVATNSSSPHPLSPNDINSMVKAVNNNRLLKLKFTLMRQSQTT